MANELTTLSTLAVEINALNEQMYFYGSQTVSTTAKLGYKLAIAKQDEGIKTNADFIDWLSTNCPNVDRSRANRYIQISKQFPDLLESTGATSRLKISQITELLSAPEEIREVVTAKIEAGEDVTIKEIQRLKKEAADLLAEKRAIQKVRCLTFSHKNKSSKPLQPAPLLRFMV